MKRFFLLILCAIFMMSIVACGNENAEIVYSIEETAKSENATAETSQIIQTEADVIRPMIKK